MFKIPRLPVVALVASAFLLTSVAPSHADYSRSLYNSLLKKIYAKSEDGDAGDIFVIIQRSLEENPQSTEDLIKKLIKTLQKNRDKLASDVSKADLDRVFKRVKKFQKQQQAARFINSGNRGNITPPESAVVGG